MNDYSWGEKVEMIRQVTVDARAVKDVAHDHSLKPYSLSHLINKARKDKNFVNLMLEKEEEHVHHRKIVVECVDMLSESDDHIASARQIREFILE
jgi:transposase-like protein